MGHNFMAAIIGQFIGAFIGIFLFSMLLEWAIFKRVMNDPVAGKVSTTLAALLLAELIWFLTSSNHFDYTIGAVSYVIASAVLGFFAYKKGLRLREEQHDDTGLASTFD